MRRSLGEHAPRIREALGLDGDMGVGLWLSAVSARELLAAGATNELRAWLRDSGLRAFTMNGFPYSDFHQPIVKYDVYVPDWASEDRVRYTLDVAEILAQLIDEGAEGSISTLPVGWRTIASDRVARAADNLVRVCDELARIEAQTDRFIHLDLEPEPGCLLQDSESVVSFFRDYVSPRCSAATSRHLRVCHDICHSAVMFEDPHEVVRRYRDASIRIGKVHVSSAIAASASRDLPRFGEERYLHQTTVMSRGGVRASFDDLPEALSCAAKQEGEWRVHFHVPVFAERLGPVETTQGAIVDTLRALKGPDCPRHFEVETYAWGVLPPEMRAPDLAAAIARELAWFESAAAMLNS